MNKQLLEKQVENSAEWAAYGDALGFITELANENILKSRTGTVFIDSLIQWERLIGGKYGDRIELPIGCYSDDTQLRLAVGRTIYSSGKFDVEAFAKVELPLWLSYGLGGGRGTKEAAKNLTKKSTNWFSNFFSTKNSEYIEGGGNGAAMRVHPHVWNHLANEKVDDLLLDVFKDAIVTHGHVRGIFGALFHALCVDFSLRNKVVPDTENWQEFIELFKKVPTLVKNDLQLGSMWLPVWEDKSGRTLENATNDISIELCNQIKEVRSCIYRNSTDPADAYRAIIEALGGFDPALRGCGSITALIAVSASLLFKDENINSLMTTVVNCLGSDTDTIATMAGAISGSTIDEVPGTQVMDRNYIREQASAIYTHKNNEQVSFSYPEISDWQPPRQSSLSFKKPTGVEDFLGLGKVMLSNRITVRKRQKNLVWQWSKFAFGQRILLSRKMDRKTVELFENIKLDDENQISLELDGMNTGSISSNFKKPASSDYEHGPINSRRSLAELTSAAIDSGFNEKLIGEHILALIDGEASIELVVAYAAIIAKARIS